MQKVLANALLDSPIPTSTGLGTNSGCGTYYSVVAGDDYSTIGAEFDVSLSDLYEAFKLLLLQLDPLNR